LPFREGAKSLSDSVKPFLLHDIDDLEKESPRSHFIAFEGDVPESGELMEPDSGPDIEAEARRIFEEAYLQGEKAGVEMGMKKVESIAKRLTGYLAGWSSFKEELTARTERLATEMALMIAETVVLKECEERRDLVVEMARKAMKICEERSEVVVRVRKEDAHYITGETISELNIIADDGLNEPGFIIETNFGNIDGKISTQFEEIRKALFSEHREY
jgi:flagellar biosynthesis/type III secretory pathway protein FliH